jgi:hypothetical protein
MGISLQRRPDRPRGELVLADAGDFVLRLLAGRHGENLLEDLLADVATGVPSRIAPALMSMSPSMCR